MTAARRGEDLRLSERHQALRVVHRGRRPRPRRPGGLVLRPARPVRLRQDDDAAHGRRAWRSRRPVRSTWASHDISYAKAVPAAGQHRVPELRPLPAPRRLRERRVRAAPAGVQGGAPGGRARARARRAAAPGPAQARPALRRPAAAHRARPRHRQPAEGAAPRRAARRAGPQAAPPDADRAQADPDRGRHHLHPRHPRPGGGHDHGRHGRGDERRAGSSSSARRWRSTSGRTRSSSRTSSASPTSCPGGARTGTAGGPWSTATASGWPCRRIACPPAPAPICSSASARRRSSCGRRGDQGDPGENRLTGGVVVDASFTGVSTQYLVRLPSGQTAVVFAQNLGLGERFPAGTTVDVAWDVDHTFALPAGASATEGIDVEDRPPADDGSARVRAVSG